MKPVELCNAGYQVEKENQASWCYVRQQVRYTEVTVPCAKNAYSSFFPLKTLLEKESLSKS